MQLQSDIKINEYSVLSDRVKLRELQQKDLLLSLSIFQDEIECAIIDSKENSVPVSCSYISHQRKFAENELLFLINDFIVRYHLRQYTYKNIYIHISTPHFVLCPSEFYVSEKKHLLLNFVHPVSSNEVILNNTFKDIKVVFGISQNIYQHLLQTFPSANLYHSSTAILNLFYYHPLLIHSKLWIHLHPTYIEVVAKNEKQFLFYNTFDVQTSLDILYYLLFCIQQLNWEVKETDVYLSGNISSQHTVFQLVQKYVHSVQLVHHYPKLHILPIDASLISHYHFITLNHYLCALYPANTKAEK